MRRTAQESGEKVKLRLRENKRQGRVTEGQEARMRVDGILFDKDGTLFDFRTTWNTWAAGTIRELSNGNKDVAEAIAARLRYDLETSAFDAASPVIAGSNREVAELVGEVLTERAVEEIELFLTQTAAKAPLAPAIPLAPFLAEMRQRGLRLGVMTNDTEYGAKAHLGAAGVDHLFDFIAGFDSGWGPKPNPEPLLAFANLHGLSPARVVMVGDSRHDLMAGKRAGMQTVGVLTGMAPAEELAPLADAVLPDIGHLASWIESR
jgi:phosphoglycolate phosphatase